MTPVPDDYAPSRQLNGGQNRVAQTGQPHFPDPVSVNVLSGRHDPIRNV